MGMKGLEKDIHIDMVRSIDSTMRCYTPHSKSEAMIRKAAVTSDEQPGVHPFYLRGIRRFEIGELIQ